MRVCNVSQYQLILIFVMHVRLYLCMFSHQYSIEFLNSGPFRGNYGFNMQISYIGHGYRNLSGILLAVFVEKPPSAPSHIVAICR